MYIPLLKEFIEPVPICVQTASLATVLELLWQENSERAVVVDEQQIPIGVISLHSLMPFLVKETTISEGISLERHGNAFLPNTARFFTEGCKHITSSGVSNPGINLQQSLQQSLAGATQLLLEPLATLPIDWSLDQFRPYLHNIEQQWGLVDSSGRCLGLLNRLRLLQFLALKASTKEAMQQPATSAMFRETVTVPLAGLNPLLELLDRLPLPLMLQTSAGRVVSQNLAWRQQVRELQDPTGIGREAAVFLEAIDRQAVEVGRQLATQSATHEDFGVLEEQGFSSKYLPNIPRSSQEDLANQSSGATSGFCQLGADADTCVCLCPMQNGQERILQFIKIPLTGVLPQLELSLASSLAEPLGQPPFSSHFQLAALELSSDSDAIYKPTLTLTQAETLWLVLAHDAEQQQVARELAAKNADLVQLNRLKDEFLACISHELKTPLTAILGLSSLLKNQSLGELNQRQARYAHLIHQSGRHLMLVVNDILDLTWIETSQMELVLEPVQIQKVCVRAYNQARQLQSIEGASDEESGDVETQFSVEIQPGLDAIVADELRLCQMLTNLLSNALKFTETGGEIGLKVDKWEGWIAFTVWDTGIGIPANKQHLVFQKFQQLESPLTRRFKGTGLGLVLTQRLARLHGGDVTFTSVEGSGSQFTLLLPPSPPQATVTRPLGAIDAVASTFSDRLVLVVEAVPKFLEDLTNQLTGMGYRVAIARSGTEALEKIRRLQPGVVFLNPLLPLLSGWDVLTLLKSDRETRHIPIVMTATREEKHQAERNGADGFLGLPIQAEALHRSLERLISQPTARQQPDLPNLTVLHLNAGYHDFNTQITTGSFPNLDGLLHPYHCRVLEADDLDQADLLARVWQPDVVLLSGVLSNPLAYLRQFGQHPFLAALPLVTLTAEVTQAANQVTGLSVFPCLAPLAAQTDPNSDEPTTSTLFQVIQVAMGMNWAPHVLVVDLAILEDWGLMVDRPATASSAAPQRSDDWLQASTQYIQAAGFRSSLSRSWSEVLQQLQHRSVDLLLICMRSVDPHPSALKALQALEQMEAKPPIVVWNCQETDGHTPLPKTISAAFRQHQDSNSPFSPADARTPGSN